MRNTLLLLVSLLNGFGGVTVQGPNNDRNLFDSFNGAPVDKPPFPFVYKDIETKSDVVLVRCPGILFKYDAPENVSYALSEYASLQKFHGWGENEAKVVWKAVVNKESEKTKVIYPCGELIPRRNYKLDKEKWDIQLEWKDPPKPLDSAILFKAMKSEPTTPDKCDNSAEVVIIMKNYEGDVFAYDPLTTELKSKDLVYMFVKRKIAEKKENYLTPCAILSPRLSIPDITIIGASLFKEDKSSGILITSFKNEIKSKNVKIGLKISNETDNIYKDFFMYESVTAISKKLTMDGKLEDNGILSVSKTNEVMFEDYQIFEVSFKCANCVGLETNVSKVFFNGLSEVDDNKTLETINYLLGNFTQTPRCPILFKTYGIIFETKFDKETAKYDDLKNGVEKNNFKVVGEEIHYKKKDPVGTLICSYKIPGGSVSTSQDFKGHPRGKILYKDGIAYYPDTPGYSMLQAEIDRKKKIQEEKEAAKRRQEERRMRIIIISSSVGISIIIAIVVIGILVILNKRRKMNKTNISKSLSKT